jgi:hypothetical protein
MKVPRWLTFCLATAFGLVLNCSAMVIVDDTWADGNRTNTSLPTDSAWFASSASSLTNYAPGSMTGLCDPGGSRTWLTYFTTTPATPVDLAVGDTLKVTLVFIPTNVAEFVSGNQRGLRVGLFNFADGGTRASADGSFVGSSMGSGTNVTGYLLNQSFYTVFPVDGPMEFWVRNNLSSGNLMGSTADYKWVGAGGPAGYLNQPGFVTGTQYTLEFSATRTATSSMAVSTRITGGSLDLFNSFTDTTYFNHRFDCFALRCDKSTNTAASFTFKEFKVEILPLRPDITAQPTDQTVFVDQNATFTVGATGQAPLSYQWRFNGTNLAGAATNTWTITNAQVANAGPYTVVVTNVAGSITSAVATLTVLLPPPTVTTLPASTVTATSATLNGTVNPQGLSTMTWFEWGTTTNYGSQTTATNVGSGTAPASLSAALTSLVTGQAYYFRCVASNASGRVNGTSQSFIPPGYPSVTTLPATNVINDAATLKAAVTPKGLPTAAWFEWGTVPTYWHQTAPVSVGPGATSVPVSNTLTGLTAGVLYHYRAVASNSLGLVRGGEVRFWAPRVIVIGSNPLTNECHAAFTPSLNRFAVGSAYASIAAGGSHSLGLRADGTVIGWGDNYYGKAIIPLSATNVVAIAAGGEHSLALRADGTVVSRGLNYYGQTNLPASTTNVVAIAAGYGHSLALRADGTVVGW